METGLRSQAHQKAGSLPVFVQSAALCYRIERGRPEVLLITTRRSRRWIIPKGWLIKGLSPRQSAAHEAWEEAGVSGVCGKTPLGRFSYVKNRPGTGAAMFLVDVFPLQVQRVSRSFPEIAQRKRKWCAPKKASHHVDLPELAALLRGFAPKLN